MQDINTRQKKARKERKFQRDKTQVGFFISQFKVMRKQKRANISWLKVYPQVKVYPQLIHWFMKLKSMFKSKELLKLGCIHNYGFKDGRWECPKRLLPNNPYWSTFKKMAEKLGIDKINRQRAFIREVFQQIHYQTFRCYYKRQQYPGVFLKKFCKQKIPESRVDFHIQKLEEFWRQLVRRGQVAEDENDSDSDSESDSDGDDGSDVDEQVQNAENQREVQDGSKRSIIDGLEEYDSVFRSIPAGQQQNRMESSRILSQDSQIEEEKQPRSPGGSRFILQKRSHSVQQSACTIQLLKSGLLTASQIEQQLQVENENSKDGYFFLQRINSDRRGEHNLRMEDTRVDQSIIASRGIQSLDFFGQIRGSQTPVFDNRTLVPVYLADSLSAITMIIHY